MLLQNKTVLIVEDEFLIAELLEDMLVELGWASFEKATSVSKALEALSNIIPDLVILDLNLDGQSSLPVAETLRARNIPFVLSSGYGLAQFLPSGGRDLWPLSRFPPPNSGQRSTKRWLPGGATAPPWPNGSLKIVATGERRFSRRHSRRSVRGQPRQRASRVA
jgi:CheY-like chemotaxis protein